MLKVRVIPVLLLKSGRLVKTIGFGSPKYVGDPINAVRIFNGKNVDELIVLDIAATIEKKKPDMKMISLLTSECFRPICYGGGISSLEEIKEILSTGVEKVVINTRANMNPSFVLEASERFGNQSIVISIDIKKEKSGAYDVFTHAGTRPISKDPVSLAVQMEKMGCGEIIVNSIDRDGTMQGYDIELLKRVSAVVTVPVVACGGAGSLANLKEAVEVGGASAVAAGSMFVLYGKYRAPLIQYPTRQELDDIFL